LKLCRLPQEAEKGLCKTIIAIEKRLPSDLYQTYKQSYEDLSGTIWYGTTVKRFPTAKMTLK
jgi:hypothetical protein